MVEVDDYYVSRNRIQYVKSPADIYWDRPLHEQREPQLFGGPDPKRSRDDLGALRRQVPKMVEKQFKDIFPGEEQSTITVAE